MNSILQANKGPVSCKCTDILFHMLVGFVGLALTLFMQWAPATHASTGAIFQRVDDIALAPLKNSYLIKDSRPFFRKPAVDHPSTARASAIPGHLWLWGFLDFLKGQPLGIALPVRRQYELVDHLLLADSLPSSEPIHEDHLDMPTQSYLSQSDDVSLNKILFEWVPDRHLRLALPEHPATVNVDPDSLIIRPDEGRQVPNSDTQTDHSEKPSASQPSTSQQAPISGSGLGERRYTGCLDGGDGGDGNSSRNGHTRGNHCPMCNNGPCEQRVDDSSGHPESYDGKGITDLPNEIVIKILSNLDIRTIFVCKHVNSNWKALIDENHLPALTFCRGLHYQPIPQTVKDYHSSTRGWLIGFGSEGEKLAEELDKHLEDKYFPKMLFFAIAEVLARTELLTCQTVFTALHTLGVSNASFSPDGHHLVTVSKDFTAKIWKLVDGQWQVKATIQHGDWINNASFSPDGHYLVTASDDYTAQIWGLVDGQWQKKATIQHDDWVNNASFSPDGQRLVTASTDCTIKIWESVHGQWQEKAIIRHDKRVRKASFSPDGQYLVTASSDYIAQIWESVHGQWQKKDTIRHDMWVENASFSPDGHYLVTASWDNTAKICELVNGQWQVKATIQHDKSVKNASFSPDGQYLVTASWDNTAQIWKLVNGQWQKKATIEHDERVNNASFSPDGQHLVTASRDNTAKIWGCVNGKWQEKATIRHNRGPVNNASFSPDGRHFVTASEDQTATIWLLKWRE